MVNKHSTIEGGLYGAFSVLSKMNVSIGNVDAFYSLNYLEAQTISSGSISCTNTCIQSNLVGNGDFSNTPICSTSVGGSVNGFKTNLIYAPQCGLFNTSSQNQYIISGSSNTWNAQWANIAEHSGNSGNIMIIDGFVNSTNDTVNRIIWEQTITIDRGKEYLFYYWNSKLNPITFAEEKVVLRTLFNGSEIPNSRVVIDKNISIGWNQRCIVWSAPLQSGQSTMTLTIQIKQAPPYDGTGCDFAIDDITLGEVLTTPIALSSTQGGDYCSGSFYTLQVVSPQTGYNYQWQYNGTNIAGATGPIYVANVSGTYTVVGQSDQGCILDCTPITITVPPLSGEIVNYTVSSSPTNPWTYGTNTSTNNPWGTTQTVWIKGYLKIAKNVNLTIKGMRFEFAPNARVIVEEGATLTIESNGSVHTVFSSYNCTGAMWQGVQVLSKFDVGTDVQLNGKLVMKANSLIENARIGVSNTDNLNATTEGLYKSQIQATSAYFKNNYIGVLIMYKSKTMMQGQRLSNISFFQNCFFQNTASLKDPTYTNGLTKAHLDLRNVNGVKVMACTFENTFYIAAPPTISNVTDNVSLDLNIGVKAIDANYFISSTSNVFNNLWIGVDHYSTNDFLQNQGFGFLEFNSCVYGIVLRGGSGFTVANSTFGLLGTLSSRLDRNYIGINGRGNKVNEIKENIFSNGYCGIVTVDWGLKKGASNINRNIFNNVGSYYGQGLYNYKENKFLQVKCNLFSIEEASIQKHWVNRGNLDRQGKFPCDDELSLPANTFVGSSPSLTDILMISEGWNSLFQYVVPSLTDPDYKPILKRQIGSSISTLGNSYTPNCVLIPSEFICADETVYRGIDYILSDIEIALENPEDTTIESLIFEALQHYSVTDSTGDSSISFLNSMPLTKAKWLLLEYYLAFGHRDDAINLFEILPVEDYEQEVAHNYFSVILNASQDERTVYDLNESEIEAITEVANSETAVAYNAQALIHYLNGTGFEVPLPYIEEEEERPLQQGAGNYSISKNIQLFPNPSSNSVNIDFGGEKTALNYEIQFIDIFGKIVKKVTISPKSSIFTIDITELSEGFYNCRIFNGNELVDTKKMVVIK